MKNDSSDPFQRANRAKGIDEKTDKNKQTNKQKINKQKRSRRKNKGGIGRRGERMCKAHERAGNEVNGNCTKLVSNCAVTSCRPYAAVSRITRTSDSAVCIQSFSSKASHTQHPNIPLLSASRTHTHAHTHYHHLTPLLSRRSISCARHNNT